MEQMVGKVTAFVTRESERGRELALLEHPYAGIQIPAGTVEVGETPAQAVMREAQEETGLKHLSIRRYLGRRDYGLGSGKRIISQTTKVYARPDDSGSDWARLRIGFWVTLNRTAHGFSQVTYTEMDRWPDPRYATMEITGWVPDEVLSEGARRDFFHLQFAGQSAERWTTQDERHRFKVFWAPLHDLPQIVDTQLEWLQMLAEDPTIGVLIGG
jgi:8-oxo-dGTP pyrophosphatase MutT (NUDIX family)